MDAYNNLPADWDSEGADYEISGTEMTVTVDGNNPTTHTLPANYIADRNFAVISGNTPVEYCTITLQHIDMKTGLVIIDDETTAEGVICGEATLDIKASEDVLAMGYEVKNAIDYEGAEITLPTTATNTATNMIYKIFYTPTEEEPETPEETENVDTADTIIKITPVFTITILFAVTTTILIRKYSQR